MPKCRNFANQIVKNKGFDNFDVGDMLVDGAIGGITGRSIHWTLLGRRF